MEKEQENIDNGPKEKIIKCTLDSPSFEQILKITGGFKEAINYAQFTESVGHMTYSEKKFNKKSDYADKVIVQGATILVDKTKNKVLVVERADVDQHGAQRLTKGGSVLVSSSPVKSFEKIVKSKLEVSDNIVYPEGDFDIIAANDVKAGYIFLVKGIRVNIRDILAMKGEKQISFHNIDDVQEILKDNKEMEYNILDLMWKEILL